MPRTKQLCGWCERREVEYDADFCSKECAKEAGDEMRLAFLEMEFRSMLERELLGTVVDHKH